MASLTPVKPNRESPTGQAASAALTLLGLAVVFVALKWSLDFIRDETAPKLAVMVVALVAGVAGTYFVFFAIDRIVSFIPIRKLREGLLPFVFVGPAVILLLVFLIYPVINTFYISFFDARSTTFVGLENYIFAFTDPGMLVAFKNNLLWLVLVTTTCVSLGLIVAVMLDRLKHEALPKSLIFLPVAISTVGASVIWRFVYAYQPPARPQIGLLNALMVAFGNDPIGWILRPPLNNLALMAIVIWLQTGFCMIVLSAAIKNVPTDLLEAARMDGANEFQLFFQVQIPYIRGTLITVATTVLIMVLKIFDVVYVMTRGNYNTQVIANRMYIEMFSYRNFGHGSALAVILFLAVTPVIILNVRNIRKQRSW